MGFSLLNNITGGEKDKITVILKKKASLSSATAVDQLYGSLYATKTHSRTHRHTHTLSLSYSHTHMRTYTCRKRQAAHHALLVLIVTFSVYS